MFFHVRALIGNREAIETNKKSEKTKENTEKKTKTNYPLGFFNPRVDEKVHLTGGVHLFVGRWV